MTSQMNYEQALDYLNSFQTYGIKLGLERMQALCKALGDPQKDLAFVHIAGTNGKGSTASFCYHMLKQAGYKTGLFTSPYIQKFNERIVVNEITITDDQLANYMNKIRNIMENQWSDYFDEPPTWFEILTCMSFLFFKEQGCHIVVLEVGLGGDLDSTNVIDQSLVSIIAIIGYDHMDVLGSTIEEIATKKAGIIKKDGLVVVYPQGQQVISVIQNRANQQKAITNLVNKDHIVPKEYNLEGQVFRYKETYYTIKMLGTHQVTNACVAIEAMFELQKKGYDKLTDQAIADGLLQTTWPGRLEIVQQDPILLIDGAHNTQGTKNLSKNLKILFPDQKLVFIVGVLVDKEYKEMLEDFYDIAHVFITITPDTTTRSLSSKDLAEFIEQKGSKAISTESVPEAVELANEIAKKENGSICGFGSLYYIGQIRDYYGL